MSHNQNATVLGMAFRVAIILAIMVAAAACSSGTDEPPAPADAPDPGAQAVSGAETPLPPLGGAPDSGTSQGTELSNEAVIDALDIALLESFPVQVNARVRGRLPNSCASIDRINQSRNGNTFEVAIATAHQTGLMCAEQPQPFEEVVSLDVAGLPAGNYVVNVSGANNVSATFELAQDNVLQTTPTPERVGASIGGIVWQDFCQLLDDGSPSGGCVADEQGGYRADGIFGTNEDRISGVNVSLRRGACPGGEEVLGSAVTDASGAYLFTALQPGTYCVSIDPAAGPNANLLLPGNWTYPGTDVGSATVTVAENGYQTADFGWDYQGDSAPEAGRDAACEDAAAFVSDVTIPDGTVLSPGESFVKIWRVRNEGNCTWGSEYSLIFDSGDQLGGPAAVPLSQQTPPGAEVDISVELTAPAAPGLYSGDWVFQAPDGTLFGSLGDYPLYVQIVVEE